MRVRLLLATLRAIQAAAQAAGDVLDPPQRGPDRTPTYRDSQAERAWRDDDRDEMRARPPLGFGGAR